MGRLSKRAVLGGVCGFGVVGALLLSATAAGLGEKERAWAVCPSEQYSAEFADSVSWAPSYFSQQQLVWANDDPPQRKHLSRREGAR